MLGRAERVVKVGVVLPMGSRMDAAYVRRFAQPSEGLQISSVWVVDHVVVPVQIASPNPIQLGPGRDANAHFREDPAYLEVIATLGFLAGCTERLTLAAGVIVVPMRNPLILAKELSSLSVLSGGRIVAGVGIGWMSEEFAALGVSFDQRGARTDEYLRAVKQLWASDGPTSFRGEYCSFENLLFEPTPVGGSVPIIIGGNSDVALRRTARLADGWYGVNMAPEEVRGARARLKVLCAAEGREGSDLRVILGAPLPLKSDSLDQARSMLQAYEAAGVDEFVTFFSRRRSQEENLVRIERLARHVLPRLGQ